jgi:hypothetical protein
MFDIKKYIKVLLSAKLAINNGKYTYQSIIKRKVGRQQNVKRTVGHQKCLT